MHMWYVSWPIQGVPEDISSVITFLLEARAYMRGGPCVVHCSPGTGRTGTVIACDLCIRDFETRRIVDIPRCLAQLRRDRAGCVQTRDQYVFIYQVSLWAEGCYYYSVFCLTTGPKPLPKRFLHMVQSKASSFK